MSPKRTTREPRDEHGGERRRRDEGKSESATYEPSADTTGYGPDKAAPRECWVLVGREGTLCGVFADQVNAEGNAEHWSYLDAKPVRYVHWLPREYRR